MRNFKFTTKTAIAAMCLLVAVFFSSCEGMKIPPAPFIITNCSSGEAAKYKYEVRSIKKPDRTTEFLMDEQYAVGDTLWVGGKKYCN